MFLVEVVGVRFEWNLSAGILRVRVKAERLKPYVLTRATVSSAGPSSLNQLQSGSADHRKSPLSSSPFQITNVWTPCSKCCRCFSKTAVWGCVMMPFSVKKRCSCFWILPREELLITPSKSPSVEKKKINIHASKPYFMKCRRCLPMEQLKQNTSAAGIRKVLYLVSVIFVSMRRHAKVGINPLHPPVPKRRWLMVCLMFGGDWCFSTATNYGENVNE